MIGTASVHLAEIRTDEPPATGVVRGLFSYLDDMVRIRKEPKRFLLALPFEGIQHGERLG